MINVNCAFLVNRNECRLKQYKVRRWFFFVSYDYRTCKLLNRHSKNHCKEQQRWPKPPAPIAPPKKHGTKTPEFNDAIRELYNIDNAAEEKIMGLYHALGGVESSPLDFVEALYKLRVLGWMHRDDVVSEYLGLVIPCPYCKGIRYDHKDGCPNVGKKFLPTIKDLLDGRAVK